MPPTEAVWPQEVLVTKSIFVHFSVCLFYIYTHLFILLLNSEYNMAVQHIET